MCDYYISVANKGADDLDCHVVTAKKILYSEGSRNIFDVQNNVKVKVSPLQAMEAHGGCGCKGPHIHSHGTRKR